MDFEVPEDLLYTDDHEWLDPETGWMGITDYAQDMVGDVVFVELPEPGDSVGAGDDFILVESMKTVSDVYSPATGEVAEVNQELEASPESVNDAPYSDGRLVRLEVEEKAELLDAEAYVELLKSEQ